jgi:hypothetical protein
MRLLRRQSTFSIADTIDISLFSGDLSLRADLANTQRIVQALSTALTQCDNGQYVYDTHSRLDVVPMEVCVIFKYYCLTYLLIARISVELIVLDGMKLRSHTDWMMR